MSKSLFLLLMLLVVQVGTVESRHCKWCDQQIYTISVLNHPQINAKSYSHLKMCAILTWRCGKTKEHKQYCTSKSGFMIFPALLIQAVHLSTVYNAASLCENNSESLLVVVSVYSYQYGSVASALSLCTVPVFRLEMDLQNYFARKTPQVILSPFS